jgi:hypothetical protein
VRFDRREPYFRPLANLYSTSISVGPPVSPTSRRINGNRSVSARTEHAAKLGEAARWIRKKHQPQATQHSIEVLIGKAKRLTILNRN